jgi:O-acetyl-ADP-ribose deacetylase (regulator of RNase III)
VTGVVALRELSPTPKVFVAATLLGSCYRVSLELARQHGVRSIAFPAISCGTYRFPIDRAAKIATATIAEALVSYAELDAVLLVAFDEHVERALRRALAVLASSA